jgi:hypothetical protein
MYSSDWRNEAGDELDEPRPVEARHLAAPLERCEPEPLHLVEEPPQARVITGVDSQDAICDVRRCPTTGIPATLIGIGATAIGRTPQGYVQNASEPALSSRRFVKRIRQLKRVFLQIRRTLLHHSAAI